jgi:hypothetical protein
MATCSAMKEFLLEIRLKSLVMRFKPVSLS